MIFCFVFKDRQGFLGDLKERKWVWSCIKVERFQFKTSMTLIPVLRPRQNLLINLGAQMHFFVSFRLFAILVFQKSPVGEKRFENGQLDKCLCSNNTLDTDVLFPLSGEAWVDSQIRPRLLCSTSSAQAMSHPGHGLRHGQSSSHHAGHTSLSRCVLKRQFKTAFNRLKRDSKCSYSFCPSTFAILKSLRLFPSLFIKSDGDLGI